MKLCKDCKHLAGNNDANCHSEICVEGSKKAFNVSVITGNCEIVYKDLQWARDMRRRSDCCGMEAKWFEQRDPTFLERMIARFKQ